MTLNQMPNCLLTIRLFTVVNDKNDCANILNNDLIAISKWAFNWKMLFNPDPKKPAQEVLFSRKKQAQIHPSINFNNVEVERAPFQKHLGVILDEKLNFKQHVDNAISKINKGIAVIKKLRYSLPRNSLITIYKSFLRPLIDYGDIIYDQPHNQCENPKTSVKKSKLCSIKLLLQLQAQYKVLLVIRFTKN